MLRDSDKVAVDLSQLPTHTRDTARGLVIDDEPLLRRSFQRILGDRYEVVFASDGAEGLEVLSRDQDFDAIICDVFMPRVDGVRVYKVLERSLPRLAARLVFFTGAGLGGTETTDFVNSVRAHNPVLRKPVPAEVIIDAIDTVASRPDRPLVAATAA